MSSTLYIEMEKEAEDEGTEAAIQKEKDYFENQDDDENEMNLMFDEILQDSDAKR